MIMETERLIIREYTDADFVALHLLLSDMQTMYCWPAPFTLEQTADWLEINIERYEFLGYGRWAVVLKETGEIIGDCGIVETELDGEIEHDLGYIIHALFWEQGYGTEAALACKQYAFDTLLLNRLCANMPESHVASERVAQKVGMQLEKTFLNPRNRNIPTLLYAATQEKP